MAEAAMKTDTTEMTTTQPAAKHPMIVFRERLDQRMAEFKNALPRHITPERFVRVALTAVQLNSDLLLANPQTLFNALMKAASDGLLPDGRQGVIVPFNDSNPRSPYKGQKVAQWMPMVAGLLQRFRNSGEFKAIMANVVYEGEPFDHWVDELGEHMKHVPGDGNGGNAKIVKAYAVALTNSGGSMMTVMSRAEIEQRRNAGRAKDSLMWTTFYAEGAKKTVLRNLSKYLPSSADDLDRLMERDDELYGVERALPAAEQPKRLTSVAESLEHFGGAGAVEPAPGESAVDGAASPPIQPGAGADGAEVIDKETGEVTTKPADSDDPLVIAHQRGVKARAENVQRRAIPPEYRTLDRKAEGDAWHAGWDGNV